MLRLFRREQPKPQATRASAGTVIELDAVRGSQAVWTPREYSKLSHEGYERSSWVFACIDVLMRSVQPTKFYVMVNDQEAPGHPLAQLLRRPNPTQGTATFISATYGNYLLSGNAYIERVGAERRASASDELWLKRPDRMRVVPGGRDSLVGGYEYTVESGSNSSVRLQPWQVRHLKAWHPTNDWYGLPPLEAAAVATDLFNEGQAHNLALMQNGARPTGAWISEAELTDKELGRLRAELTEMARVGARGRPMLLEGHVKWQELGATPRDMDWSYGQESAARQIHAVFGVHPVLTGLAQGTFDNQRQARSALLTNTALPFIDMFVGELNEWLGPLYPGAVIYYDRDAYPALTDDQESLWRRADRGFTRGFITKNEARQLVGYDKVDDGDDFIAKPVATDATVATTALRSAVLDALVSVAGEEAASLPRTASAEDWGSAIMGSAMPHLTAGDALLSRQAIENLYRFAVGMGSRLAAAGEAALVTEHRDWVGDVYGQALAEVADEVALWVAGAAQ